MGGTNFPQCSRRAKGQAQTLRRTMSPPEILFWRALHENQMIWECFHQWPIRGYIIDFWFPRFQLAVEIDGKHHLSMSQIVADEYRDWVLAGEGIKTTRIPARIVLADIDEAIATVQAEIAMYTPRDIRPIHY